MKKPFVGIIFKCCNIYSRLYLNKQGTAYEGACPKCYKKKAVIQVVNSGGSKDRFFEVD